MDNNSQDDIFYEIEYDSFPRSDTQQIAEQFAGQNAGQYVRKAAKIEPPPKDEIRELFHQMRDIGRENRTFSFNSNRFYDARIQREKAGIFYKQGLFMKDFEDHYEKVVPYTSYYPFYQMMGYEQLRTYFTWRTKVRSGIVDEVSLSYAFLYIYELLNNIGVNDPQDGLGQLMFFWKEFRVYDQTVDKYVIKWLKDYHIYYELPWSFREFVEQYDLWEYYQEVSESGGDFDLFCSIAKYDIRKSVFFTEDRSELIKKCFAYTMDKIRQVLLENGINYEEFIYQAPKSMTAWTPFMDALFFPWLRQRDRRVVLSEKEIYVCSQNSWKFQKTLTLENGRQFLGYVIKQMESVLREVTKYKYTITASIQTVNPVTRSILKAVGISLEELITNTVKEYYREATKTVVRVDQNNLNRIRQEALMTQEKLIVEDDAVQRSFPAAQSISDMQPASDVQPISDARFISDAQAFSDTQAFSVVQPLSDPWAELKAALSKTELKALQLILHGEANIKQFADEQNIMLEVLMDGINEKAMDFVGDSILDSEFAIYEDYIEQVKEILSY